MVADRTFIAWHGRQDHWRQDANLTLQAHKSIPYLAYRVYQFFICVVCAAAVCHVVAPRASASDETRSANEAMRVAIRNKDVDGVLAALARGTTRRATLEALVMTCAYGDTTIATALLDAGVDVNGHVEAGITALILSGYTGQVASVRLLLEYGADPNLKNNDGEPPLSTCAASEEADEIVPILIRAGADVTVRDGRMDRTPLIWMAQYGHLGAVQALIEAQSDIDAVDVDGRDALSLSAEFGHAATVRYLLAMGANAEKGDHSNKHPIDYARENGHEAIVKQLEEAGLELRDKSR